MFKNKLLLILTILSFVYSSAFAANEIPNFYLKATITATKINDIKVSNPTMNFYLENSSKLSPVIGLGIGYYFNNYIRADLMAEHLNLIFNRESDYFNYIENNVITNGVKTIKRKARGNSLMINSYIDLMSRESYKFFTGIGLGVVQIKETITNSISGNATINDQLYKLPSTINTHTSKRSTNFAHSLMVGANIKIYPELNLELMYSYRDFGKSKHKTENAKMSKRYKGHNFSMGIRFDL